MDDAMGIPKSTLRRIRKQGEELNEHCGSATRITASRKTD